MQPLVSVVVAVKNGERFIQKALESILAQSYTHFEIIVIDGHSTDQTASIARAIPQVRYFLQEGKGISEAYNQGIRAAQGEFVAFLSHDDLWRREKLELQVPVLLHRPEIDYVICRATFFLENPDFIPPGFRRNLLEGDHVTPIMEALLARRSLFDRIGMFDPSYRSAGDVDWFVRANEHGIRGETIQKALFDKRIHDRNTSLTTEENNQEILQILKHSIQRKRLSKI